MMIILLYSAAILIETILLVYLRLRLVKVRLPEPCSSRSCKTSEHISWQHKQQIIRTLVIFYFKDQLTVLFLSIKQKHDSQNSLVWFASLELTD